MKINTNVLTLIVIIFSLAMSGNLHAGITHNVIPGDDIQAAINAADPGDTILFAAGTYGLNATLNVTKSLTLRGPQVGVHPLPSRGSTRSPGDTSTEAILDGQGAVSRIILVGANGVTIDGLEIRNGKGDLIRQSDSYSGTIIRNCIVHDAIDDEGIQLAKCTNGLIEYNYVYNVAQDGANFAESTNCAILNNEITSSNSENGAIFVYDSVDIAIGCNYIYNTTANNGIKLYTNYGDITVMNNLIVNNSWEINSKHHEYSGNAILGYKPVVTGSTLAIKHNTISDNAVSLLSLNHYGDVDFGNGIGLNTNVSFDGNVSIINNIITSNGLLLCGWGVITKPYEGILGPTNCSVDYNDIYENGAGISLGTCPLGPNNIYSDPMFNSDYTLQSGSPCIGTAGDSEDMGVLFDECGWAPPVIEVEIDIKPGSDPNCFNSDSHGVIPVAILGSADFDVTMIDLPTVQLDSQGVRVKGKSGNWGSFEYVNDDEFLDLVVQIIDEGEYEVGSTIGTITALTLDGTPIEGKDSICITR